jgi:uroporphyrinogen-III synthase
VPGSKTVVLTREPEDNRDLADALRRAGARVREIPCVSTRLRDPDPGEISRLPDPADVGALAFTSRRGVMGWQRWAAGSDWSGRLAREEVLVAAVGGRTARALDQAGVVAQLVADPPRGEVLAGLLADRLDAGRPVVLCGGQLRAGGLEQGLERAGHPVHPLTLYVNEAPRIPVLEPFAVAAVLVASPSAGRRLLAAMPWMRDCVFVSIGPVTSRALEELGVGDVREPGPDPADWERELVAASRDPQ